jgi:hypothetical protein
VLTTEQVMNGLGKHSSKLSKTELDVLLKVRSHKPSPPSCTAQERRLRSLYSIKLALGSSNCKLACRANSVQNMTQSSYPLLKLLEKKTDKHTSRSGRVSGFIVSHLLQSRSPSLSNIFAFSPSVASE